MQGTNSGHACSRSIDTFPEVTTIGRLVRIKRKLRIKQVSTECNQHREQHRMATSKHVPRAFGEVFQLLKA